MVQSHRNQLLVSMPDASRERLMAALEWVELPFRMALVEPGVEAPFVHFLESGIASVVLTSRDGAQELEVGHVGFDGMTGFHALLGMDRTLTRTFMQVAGSGWRISVDVLRSVVAADEALRDHLHRYVHAYQMQLAYSALANGRYTIPERLARWLLMCHDRLDTDAIPLTHEFLATMLGVRRSGVTNELHVLEGKHAVRAARGRITVVDRARLERLAGPIYGAPEAEYETVFGAFRTKAQEARLSLAGMRVMIVEDDFDLAMGMKRHLVTQGVEVVGPSPSVQDSLRLLMATPDIDAAVVDVNLRGEMSFPVAEALRERDVPFIFVSGYGQSLIPAHLEDVDFYNKPIELPALTAALVAVA